MEIIYRADNGKEFSDPKDCVIYEQSKLLTPAEAPREMPRLRMWDVNAECNDDAASAIILDIGNTQGARQFIAQCKQDDDSYDGICDDSRGYYVWTDKYVAMDLDTMETIYRWYNNYDN